MFELDLTLLPNTAPLLQPTADKKPMCESGESCAKRAKADGETHSDRPPTPEHLRELRTAIEAEASGAALTVAFQAPLPQRQSLQRTTGFAPHAGLMREDGGVCAWMAKQRNTNSLDRRDGRQRPENEECHAFQAGRGVGRSGFPAL